ncbi:unnamed protein product [Gadus morhua 'NCC']
MVPEGRGHEHHAAPLKLVHEQGLEPWVRTSKAPYIRGGCRLISVPAPPGSRALFSFSGKLPGSEVFLHIPRAALPDVCLKDELKEDDAR